jgi:exodeoxyribonuclease V alpha subunit
MPLQKSNRRMLTRQLLYTTMTRAVGTFIAVGQLEALQMAVATDKPARCYTQLSQFLLTQEEDLTGAMGELGCSRWSEPRETGKVCYHCQPIA